MITGLLGALSAAALLFGTAHVETPSYTENVHDGSLIHANDRHYYDYGVRYQPGTVNGFPSDFGGVWLLQSTDVHAGGPQPGLQHWNHAQPAFDAALSQQLGPVCRKSQGASGCYEPRVTYAQGQYVMWLNVDSSATQANQTPWPVGGLLVPEADSGYLVFTSPTPTGPFVPVRFYDSVAGVTGGAGSSHAPCAERLGVMTQLLPYNYSHPTGFWMAFTRLANEARGQACGAYPSYQNEFLQAIQANAIDLVTGNGTQITYVDENINNHATNYWGQEVHGLTILGDGHLAVAVNGHGQNCGYYSGCGEVVIDSNIPEPNPSIPGSAFATVAGRYQWGGGGNQGQPLMSRNCQGKGGSAQIDNITLLDSPADFWADVDFWAGGGGGGSDQSAARFFHYQLIRVGTTGLQLIC